MSPGEFFNPGKACKFHHEFFEREGENEEPALIRKWVTAALEPGTVVHEQYDVMAWDLDRDLCQTRRAFWPEGDYLLENANRDLRRIWRQVVGRYALGEAWRIEDQLWKVEQTIWKVLTDEQRKFSANPISLRLWRWKDHLLWRLGVAALAGYALLMSSTGLWDVLHKIDKGHFVGRAILICGLATFLLALAEVERRAGRRPWRVLGWRALGMMACGAFWTLLLMVAHSIFSEWLGFDHTRELVLLSGASALLLGHVFQVFWQDRSVAEPW